MKKAQVRAVLLADGMSTSLSLAPWMFRLGTALSFSAKLSNL